MSKLQFKKIEIYGTDLSQFDKERNQLTSGVFVLTHNESIAIKNLLNNWIDARNADNYRVQAGDFLMNLDEIEQLKNKLKSNVHYEKI
jgi:hypothetical protein